MPIFVPKATSFNPRPTHCPVCQTVGDLVLLIGDTHLFGCAHCHYPHLGKPDDGRCIKCSCINLEDLGVPAEDCKFPAPIPCPSCQEKLAKIRAGVTLGGLAFRCIDCGAMGFFHKDDPRTTAFRANFPEATLEAAWSLDKTDCPDCRAKTETT